MEQVKFSAKDLLGIWLKEREIQNQSKHTLQAYERDVADFLEFCAVQQLTLNNVEATDLRQFLAEKVEQHGLSSSSLQRMLSSIRQFMKWAEQAQYLAFNPADDFQLKRQSRPLPGMVDIETVNQILDQPAPETEAQQQMWLRDKAILELLYSSGLRLAEIQSLRIKDVDFNRQLLRITGKGNKTRVVPFGSKAKDSLMEWLKVYPLWNGDFVPDANVFITQKAIRSVHGKLKTGSSFRHSVQGLMLTCIRIYCGIVLPVICCRIAVTFVLFRKCWGIVI